MTNQPLSIALSVAVPLRIAELERIGGPSAEETKKVVNLGKELSFLGDVLLFGGGKKGEVAELFNGLVNAIAVLSFCPVGVKLFGSHWEGKVQEKEDDYLLGCDPSEPNIFED